MEECGNGDFYELVKRDMTELSISSEAINETKEKLREVLETKTNQSAFDFLIVKAQAHNKVPHHIYHNCHGMAHYHDKRFTADLANILFKFRTRTFMVKNNFRNNYRNTNIDCPLCGEQNDTQSHIFECRKIMAVFSDFSCKQDIFSNNVETLYTVACTLKKLVHIREELLDTDHN